MFELFKKCFSHFPVTEPKFLKNPLKLNKFWSVCVGCDYFNYIFAMKE